MLYTEVAPDTAATWRRSRFFEFWIEHGYFWVGLSTACPSWCFFLALHVTLQVVVFDFGLPACDRRRKRGGNGNGSEQRVEGKGEEVKM